MSTIPLSKDFSITPNVITPAGEALGANGLFLINSELVPVGVVATYYSLAEVGDTFGTDSREYLAAQVYFGGYDNASIIPAELKVARTLVAPQSASITSGSIKGINLSQFQALKPEALTLTLNGGLIVTKPVDFTKATSFTDIASIIATAIGSDVKAYYLSVQNKFFIKTLDQGEDTSISFVSQSATADLLKLTADTGAVLSAGADSMPFTALMDSIVEQSQDFVAFTSLVELTDDQAKELCAWNTAQHSRFIFSYWSTSDKAIVANNPECFNKAVVEANGFSGVFPVYGDYRYGVMPLAYCASVNFNQTSGRVSFKFRGFEGLKPNVTTLSAAKALDSNGYNYYGSYSLNKTLKQYSSEGRISGKFLWVDTYLDQVWINANLVSAYAELFTANQSYSFNDQGYSAIQAATIDVADKALNFGAIQPGVTLDAAQLRNINTTIKRDISSVLYNSGWYLYIPTQAGSSRINRSLDGVVFYWVDGQLIQSVNLSSTAVL